MLTTSLISQETYLKFHLSLLAVLLAFGIASVWYGRRLQSDEARRRFRLVLAILLLVSRVVRYPIEASVGAFTWDSVFSLHVCHINLILLLICLVKPNDFLFNYCFLIGIPMALVSGIFPGDIDQSGSLLILRGSLFVLSHLLMVIATIYLAIVEKMKPTWLRLKQIYLLAIIQIAITFGANLLFKTNFLYIMTPIEGTPILTLHEWLGWPGYAFAMIAMGFVTFLIMKLAYDLISRVSMVAKTGQMSTNI